MMTLRCLFVLLVLCWVGDVMPANAGQANVFIYHRFGESRYPSTNISLKVFEQQLALLQKRDVQVLALGEVAERLKTGRPLPEHCAVLTVDDGFRSFLLRAMPLLRRYGYPVTLFINTDAVGGRNYLNWSELQALSAEGVEIGSHTASHPHMVNHLAGESDAAWLSRVTVDLERAKHAFAAHLSQLPDLFAYPYGEYSPQVQKLVHEAGFKVAVAQQSGVVSASSDLFALPRFPMGGGYATLDQFRQKLFMRPLPIKVVAPRSPLLEGVNPPLLEFSLNSDSIDVRRMKCYVSGQPAAEIVADPVRSGMYRVMATQTLTGRRTKYTLTAPGKAGGWYWFSFLWIRSDVPEGGY